MIKQGQVATTWKKGYEKFIECIRHPNAKEHAGHNDLNLMLSSPHACSYRSKTLNILLIFLCMYMVLVFL